MSFDTPVEIRGGFDQADDTQLHAAVPGEAVQKERWLVLLLERTECTDPVESLSSQFDELAQVAVVVGPTVARRTSHQGVTLGMRVEIRPALIPGH